MTSKQALSTLRYIPELSASQALSNLCPSSRPAVLRNHFPHLPAISKWFSPNRHGTSFLNIDYFTPFRETILPMEISSQDQFARGEQSLGFFIDASQQHNSHWRVYIAQAALSDLPSQLREDFRYYECHQAPLQNANLDPETMVLQAGRGDLYSTSLWLGRAPTYTPLHRDPNHNLFVQIAGQKKVRLCTPDSGRELFERVKGGKGTLRTEEDMMVGEQTEELEQIVWGQDNEIFLEAKLNPGDGLFIPLAWWHSIRSVREGMIGSVNWWFR
ncbi:Clavaminate synthase-like protein [Piedraia hortae CBS 480.64]|uniref:Clavaminate synthase-like protein n=1 Tax=Piedraia hortae CBS 480.64 TaxID=1314780 RepID=A0A6A7C0N1_9PEZI|nr:Clavaminate synthase-like protein [Piedraia hortae CBS 480.64]